MSLYFRASSWLALALFLFALSPFAKAQTAVDGAIGGTVLDNAGAVVGGAAVNVHNNATNAEQVTTTDPAGYFRVIHLQPGAYNVTITATGFDTFRSVNLTVQVGLLTDVEARMKVGSSTQTVEVSGEAPAINTTSPDFNAVIGSHVLDDLPVNNYRWSSYALLTPGVVSDSNGFGLLSFRGQSTLLNNVTFDGADDNQKFFAEERGRTRAGYSTDKWAVQEFQVNTSNYSVEYGRSAGGVVNAVSKSGTNQFHGEGYFFNRDSAWGAYNAFTTLAVENSNGTFVSEPFKATDLRKQYGFGVGGPILQDKLFFFLAADRFFRDFPGISVPSNANAFYAAPSTANLSQLQAALNISQQTALADYNNAIAGLTSMLGVAPRTGDQTIYFPKIDWQVNSKNHASFEYNRLRWTSPAGIQTGTGGLNYGVRSYGNDYVRDNWGIAKLDTFLTPTISNEVRYQYGRDFEFEFNQQPTPYEESTLIGPTAGGYTNPFGNIPPEVTITNAFEFGTPNFLERPAYPDERMWQLTDTVEWTRGHHDFKFGYDMVHTYDLSENLTSQYGTYSYSSIINYIEDFYLAQNPATAAQAMHYSSYSQGFGTLGFNFSTVDYAGFVQDEWKVNPRLSLTLGLRYEFEQLPSPQLPNNSSPVAQINLAQTAAFPSNETNIGPRVGFAYDLSGHGQTVLRGGYGEFFARVINSTIYNAIAQTGNLATSANGTPLAQLQFSYQTSTTGAPAFPRVIPNAGAAGTPPNVIYFDPNFKVPEIHQADLTFEHSFTPSTVFSITWLGAWGRRLPDFVDQNLPTPISVQYTVVDPTRVGPYANGTVLTSNFFAKGPISKITLANGVVTNSSGRPNPYYGSLTDIFSGVNSNYEGVVFQINKRLSHNFDLHANYTWSHALDYGENNTTFTNTNSLLDPTNLRADYGNSNQNVPNRIVAYAIYDTPWRHSGWLSYLVNDYEIAPDFQAQNGLPYSAGTNGSTSTIFTDSGATISGLGSTVNGSGGAARMIGLDRNYAQQARTIVVDMRLSKRFAVGDRAHFEFLAEAFNLANHQNVTSVNTTAYAVGSDSTNKINTLTANTLYGTVTNTNSEGFVYSPRQLQLGLRLQF